MLVFPESKNVVLGFHISNPRKGTETSWTRCGHTTSFRVSTYLIPARGLKLVVELAIVLRLDAGQGFHISNPRKGTETFRW